MRRRRKVLAIFIIGSICGIYIEKYIRSELESRFSTPSVNSTWDQLSNGNYDIHNMALYLSKEANLYKESSVAKKNFDSIKVLCWVLTTQRTLHTKAQAVKDTWGQRCHTLLFFSSEPDKEFPAISLNVKEGYQNLPMKTFAAWKYIFEHHQNEASWFIKADDDTFVVMENLRHFLSSFSPTKSYFFGRNLWNQKVDYNSGGAGYVFSKETLRRFVQISTRCQPESKAEDIAVAYCLKQIGVEPGETRDSFGRETFHPFAPDFHLIPDSIEKDNWIFRQSKWEVTNGPGCCSKYSIAFHYTTPKRMYLINYYLYILKKGFEDG